MPAGCVKYTVPLVPQSAENTCWYACMVMLWRYHLNANPQLAPLFPAANSEVLARLALNRMLLESETRRLVEALGFRVSSINWNDGTSLFRKLVACGPVSIQGLLKSGMFGHMVVITGMCDTDVFFNDPAPPGSGCKDFMDYFDFRSLWLRDPILIHM